MATVSPAFRNGQREAHGLKYSRRGLNHHAMSAVIHVYDAVGIGVSTISFSDELVSDIGKHMPRGVGPDDPVFLKVVQRVDHTWEVRAQYIRDKSVEILLWVTKERPSWVRNVQRFTNT